MRKNLCFIITIILCFFAIPFVFSSNNDCFVLAQSNNIYQISVSPQEDSVYRGKAFKVDINLDSINQNGLLALGLQLKYNTNKIALSGVERGDALSSLNFTTTNTDTYLGYSITPFRLLWDADEFPDYTCGKLITLIFEAKDVQTSSKVDIEVDCIQDCTKAPSFFGTITPQINIINGSIDVLCGDGYVTYKDYDGSILYETSFLSTELVPSYPFSNPTREDDIFYTYTFNGFKSISNDSSSLIIFEAQYIKTPVNYNVWYYVDGELKDVLVVGYKENIDLSKPIYEDFEFYGWFLNQDYSGYTTFLSMPAEDITLYGYTKLIIRQTDIPVVDLSITKETDDYVFISANMTYNSGFNGLVLTLNYDKSALTFVDYQEKFLFSNANFSTSQVDDITIDGFSFYWHSNQNIFSCGEFLNLKFLKNKDKSGCYPITFSCEKSKATFVSNNKEKYTEIDINGVDIGIGFIDHWVLENIEEKIYIEVNISGQGMKANTLLEVKEVGEEVDIDEENINLLAEENKQIKTIYSIKFLQNGKEIQPNGNLSITLKLNGLEKKYKNLSIYHLNSDGSVTQFNSSVKGENISFYTNQLSCFLLVGEPNYTVNKVERGSTTMFIVYLSILIIALLSFVIVQRSKSSNKKNSNIK